MAYKQCGGNPVTRSVCVSVCPSRDILCVACVSVHPESSLADMMSSSLFSAGTGREDPRGLTLVPGAGFVGRSSQLGRLSPDFSHRSWGSAV